jgi:hypothetical protein
VTENLRWHKSTYSDNANGCVEVAPIGDGGMAVRDTKDHGTGPILRFTRGEWDAFVAGARDGEFDLSV